MNTLLITGTVQALFLALLVHNKRKKVQPDFILVSILLSNALNQLFFFLNNQDSIGVPEWLLIILAGSPLVSGPMLYWYVLSLTRKNQVQVKTFVVHLIPYVIYLVGFLVLHFGTQDLELRQSNGFVLLHSESFPYLINYYSQFLPSVFCLWLMIYFLWKVIGRENTKVLS